MQYHDLSPATVRFLSTEKKNLIGKQWLAAGSLKTFTSENPANKENLAQIAHSSSIDIDLAVQAARNAFTHGSWSLCSGADRGKMLWQLADLIEANARELAELETLDNGKPYSASLSVDIPLSARMFRYMAGWADKIYGETFPISTPGEQYQDYAAYTLKEPAGVVGQIIPWNFPLLMAAWKLAPALASGCAVILKPAEQTPLTALRLGELIQEAGFPPGAVNIVTGFGDVGAYLAAHHDVDKVAFTGSTEVGKEIVAAASGNLKRVSLELGGKSPNIIFKDADLDKAIPAAAAAIYFNHGQCCCAGSRLYVEQEVYEEVIAGIAKIAASIKLCDPFAAECEMGPLISETQYQRVKGYLESGLEEGAKIHPIQHAESPDTSKGYFVNPQIFTQVKTNMKIAQEEIFGPVLCAFAFEDERALLYEANNSTYGLAAGVWTKDISKAHRFTKKLQAGTVWVNCYNQFDPALPFGGYKESGWQREMGKNAIELYQQSKSVCIHHGN